MVMRDIDVAIMLLKVAKCPNCDGSGAIMQGHIDSTCCGEPLGTGECCGNAIPDMVWEAEQCQGCAEKMELIAKYDSE